ncbi:hypothetical protein ABE033_10380 [Priestia megaterium]
MNNLYHQKELAKTYRKNNNYHEALTLYKELWETTHDKYDATGYLHCLRKLKKFTEAIPLAKELEKQYSDFNWCRIEIIWTYISGILNNLEDGDSLGKTIQVAQRIMSLNPDEVALQKTVFTVLKKAKQLKKWDVCCDWIDKLDPDKLSDTSIKTDKGDTGWNYQLIWYHHKIRCLIHQRNLEEAVEKADLAIKKSKQQKKYFQRLKAVAFQEQGYIQEAEEIFSELCNAPKADWWMLHDYALLLKSKGENKVALQMMYKAACFAFRLEGTIGMIQDIVTINTELNRIEEAFYHLHLYKAIRERNKWKVPEQVLKQLEDISEKQDYPYEVSFNEARRRCETYWGKNQKNLDFRKKGHKVKKGLNGRLTRLKVGVPFCFIQTNDKDSFFCYVSDIPGKVNEGAKVTFDVIPAFDKKKQKESWKATNISLVEK